MENFCQPFYTTERNIPLSSIGSGIYRNIPSGYALPVSLAKNIRHLRRFNDLTQDQLADLIGVEQGLVSKWEGGKAKPKAAILPRLAVKLGASLDKLMEGLDVEYDASRDRIASDQPVKQQAPAIGANALGIAVRMERLGEDMMATVDRMLRTVERGLKISKPTARQKR